ncbi:hypothetical protein D9611_004089 [Ephemerocybe angulata]|uniref:Uncharacterized protein n=1 Tax=Ephemerocybe angulata TaxID=980116 RepID=A0A8H5F5L5_9AGAR|nr:hypothetical protein D9611_004089 [Tulosesus angulatus]
MNATSADSLDVYLKALHDEQVSKWFEGKLGGVTLLGVPIEERISQWACIGSRWDRLAGAPFLGIVEKPRAFYQDVLSLISLWLGFQENRDTKNPTVQILYRDGMYFIASMTTLSAGNIIVNFVGPPIHKFFLAEIHRVMHTTLSARMILHVRELSQRRLIPQFTVRDGVLIELSAVEDRTTETSE